jgi:hypothetical protein
MPTVYHEVSFEFPPMSDVDAYDVRSEQRQTPI